MEGYKNEHSYREWRLRLAGNRSRSKCHYPYMAPRPSIKFFFIYISISKRDLDTTLNIEVRPVSPGDNVRILTYRTCSGLLTRIIFCPNFLSFDQLEPQFNHGSSFFLPVLFLPIVSSFH